MKTSRQIATESGMSKMRVNQYASSRHLPKLGTQYIWDEDAEKDFYSRIGKRGDKLTSKLDDQPKEV